MRGCAPGLPLLRTRLLAIGAGSGDLDWRRIATKFVHPLKLKILREMADGKPRGSSDVARAVDEKMQNVAFHMGQLEKAGLVEFVGTESRPGGRGMVVRLYRARSE